MDNCIFCKIVRGDIPSTKVYEDDTVLAFRDVNPQAPVHVLVIPKKHVQSVLELTEEDGALLADIFSAVRRVAAQEGLEQDGFRLVSNVGKNGGQTVPHLHFHILGKKAYGEDFG